MLFQCNAMPLRTLYIKSGHHALAVCAALGHDALVYVRRGMFMPRSCPGAAHAKHALVVPCPDPALAAVCDDPY